MMTPLFLFDCDGTLTPSRGKINEDLRLFMVNFCEKHDCYLVTGSDQPKTIEQIGSYLYNCFKKQFQNSGNVIYDNNTTKIYETDWNISDECREWLEDELEKSDFSVRTGNHIEERTGTVNFSIVGRNANIEQRRAYVDFEACNGERRKIADAFNLRFPELQATIGGETGLDITPIGKDKSQVLKYLENRKIYFFGDACQPGGNDYPLASVIIEKNLGFVYNVTGYQQTWNILKEIDNALP